MILPLWFITGLLTLAWASPDARAESSVPAPVIHTVVIENMKFHPEVLQMKLGDRVLFKNADLYPHTATAVEAGGFDSGTLLENQTWEFQPARKGTFAYKCRFHPTMLGSIVVADVTPEMCP